MAAGRAKVRIIRRLFWIDRLRGWLGPKFWLVIAPIGLFDYGLGNYALLQRLYVLLFGGVWHYFVIGGTPILVQLGVGAIVGVPFGLLLAGWIAFSEWAARADTLLALQRVLAIAVVCGCIGVPLSLVVVPFVHDPVSRLFAAQVIALFAWLGTPPTPAGGEATVKLVHIALSWMAISVTRRALWTLWNRLTNSGRSETATTITEAVLRGEAEVWPYVLYLRTFHSTGMIGRTLPVLYRGSFLRGGLNEFEGYMHESLYTALQTNVIGLGREGEGVGVGRVTVHDEDWQTVVEALAERAEMIVLLVSGRAGTAWEIEHVFEERYLYKTIFVAPPDTNKSTFGSYRPQEEYAAAAAVFERKGKRLPEWQSGGLAFRYNHRDPVPHNVVALNFQSTQKSCADALRSVIAAMQGSDQPATNGLQAIRV